MGGGASSRRRAPPSQLITNLGTLAMWGLLDEAPWPLKVFCLPGTLCGCRWASSLSVPRPHAPSLELGRGQRPRGLAGCGLWRVHLSSSFKGGLGVRQARDILCLSSPSVRISGFLLHLPAWPGSLTSAITPTASLPTLLPASPCLPSSSSPLLVSQAPPVSLFPSLPQLLQGSSFL